jgi:cyclohexadienyl dehydratase
MSPIKTAALALLVTASAIAVPAHAGNVDDVIKSGVLRACTPGDYKPFSFAKPDGTYEGIDIDLMQSLATSLGVKVEYVKTTWANLLADFTANKCDIAVGGISVTLDRQKRVGFSNAYMG